MPPIDTQNPTRELLDYLDASPTPWHAVASAEARLREKGFVRLDDAAHWQLTAGGRYYVVRGESSDR